MKFRKKPVVIEAMQFNGTEVSAGKIMTWMDQPNARVLRELVWADDELPVGELRSGSIVIPSLEGDMRAVAGDWIIKGVKGEFYPCKPDIFEATYEAVEVAESAMG